MVYHSKWNKEDPAGGFLMGMGVYPLRSCIAGPAPEAPELGEDIVDEAIDKFKANVMFRNFKPEGPADLVHLYLLLYIHQCLQRFDKCENKRKAQEAVNELLALKVLVPFDSEFPVSPLYTQSTSASEKRDTVKYFAQLRREASLRLIPIVYDAAPDQTGDKWWLCFAKRAFLKKPLK
eukprot:TRINITY_DN583_c0_g1_i7.p2 TRINITY_DN583_c0_g1~~TRINITY_DN583_c0_g1_i7.p2  ORF type:complete len:178 (+),score=37.16 TRINITY_DN583_c0_g1_i7:257-790(+)